MQYRASEHAPEKSVQEDQQQHRHHQRKHHSSDTTSTVNELVQNNLNGTCVQVYGNNASNNKSLKSPVGVAELTEWVLQSNINDMLSFHFFLAFYIFENVLSSFPLSWDI